jgi:HEAT repeat protein
MQLTPTFSVVLLLALSAAAAELVYVDGRRETVDDAKLEDGAVLVRFERGLRRVPRSDVAKIVGNDGHEETIARAMVPGALTAEQRADLDGLAKVDDLAFLQARQRLAASMSEAVLARLGEIAASSDPAARARAGDVMVKMGTEASVDAAVALGLGDASDKVRTQVASSLSGIAGLVATQGWQEKLRPGLEHKDRTVRALFSLALGRAGDATAIPVLRRDALTHADHHVRESAAETLAELGDDGGLDLLLKMARRTKHPAGDDAILLAERIRVCGLLGKLGNEKAVTTLKTIARSRDESLADAAKQALDAIAVKRDG